MTGPSETDPLAAFIELHRENVQLNVSKDRNGFVANLFVMDWTRRGRVVQEFFYWSAAHDEIPQPTIEAAIEQLRSAVQAVGHQFFVKEVAERFVRLASLPQEEVMDWDRAVKDMAELIWHARVNRQADWVQGLRHWCGHRLEDPAFDRLLDAIKGQLDELIRPTVG